MAFVNDFTRFRRLVAPIETLRSVDDDQLIEAAVAEAAQAYTDLGCGDGGGVLLYPYEPASALALRVRDVESFLAEGEELEELGMPEPQGAAWTELEDRIEADGGLAEPFYVKLAARLSAGLRCPVLVDEIGMPYREQLARQSGKRLTNDPLAGFDDVLVSLRVDDYRVAVLFRDAVGQIRGSGSYGYEDHPLPAGEPWTELGTHPVVLAGTVPEGTIGVSVRVGPGAWTEAEVHGSHWICQLAARVPEREAEIRYRSTSTAND